jgi:hypothetical protein
MEGNGPRRPSSRPPKKSRPHRSRGWKRKIKCWKIKCCALPCRRQPSPLPLKFRRERPGVRKIGREAARQPLPLNHAPSPRKIDSVRVISAIVQRCPIPPPQSSAQQGCAPSRPQPDPSRATTLQSRNENSSEILKRSVLAGLSAVAKASQEGGIQPRTKRARCLEQGGKPRR